MPDMYDRLKSQMRAAVTQPRPLKPQTERHIHEHLDSEQCDWQTFFDRAAERLEEYEIDMLFGPLFTPDLDELARMSEVLRTWTPTEADCKQLVDELTGEQLRTEIHLPDEGTAALPLHTVVIDRYVRLQRLGFAPDPATASALCDAVPASVRTYALAIARHRAFATVERQQWLARFLGHVGNDGSISIEYLMVLVEFMGSQRDLAPDAVTSAATDTLRSARTALSAAQRGHTYLSSDVAEHHHYRGQGVVDKRRVNHRQREVELLKQLEADLYGFFGLTEHPSTAS